MTWNVSMQGHFRTVYQLGNNGVSESGALQQTPRLIRAGRLEDLQAKLDSGSRELARLRQGHPVFKEISKR